MGHLTPFLFLLGFLEFFSDETVDSLHWLANIPSFSDVKENSEMLWYYLLEKWDKDSDPTALSMLESKHGQGIFSVYLKSFLVDSFHIYFPNLVVIAKRGLVQKVVSSNLDVQSLYEYFGCILDWLYEPCELHTH